MNSLLKNEFSDEKDDLFQSLPAKGHTFNRSSELRNCPVCSIKMDNTQFQYSSGIWIDSCPEGHGIWIDGGEMQLLKEYIFSSKDFEEKVDFRINRMKWFYGEVYNSLYINLPDKKRKHYYSLVLDEWCMLQGIDRYERVQIRDVGYVNRKKTCVTPPPPGDFTMEREISYAVKDGLLDEEKVAKIKNKYFSFETWKASGCNRG
jgi:Zn-finger nucleic acid-binding protein